MKPELQRKRGRGKHTHKPKAPGLVELFFTFFFFLYLPLAFAGFVLMGVAKLLIKPSHMLITGFLDYHFQEGDFAPKKKTTKKT
ncbi:hypothetical protein LCGC14_1351150 [marine sediment metagenome]|uniref:Uncharacterized protein n=1 Tax=marine sediment metagenome TaxID=412755 RepID=A0A0F9ND75_9ZZZZ